MGGKKPYLNFPGTNVIKYPRGFFSTCSQTLNLPAPGDRFQDWCRVAHLRAQHGSRVESLSFDRQDCCFAACHTDWIQTALCSPSSYFYDGNLWAGGVKSTQRNETTAIHVAGLFCFFFYYLIEFRGKRKEHCYNSSLKLDLFPSVWFTFTTVLITLLLIKVKKEKKKAKKAKTLMTLFMHSTLSHPSALAKKPTSAFSAA